MTHKPTHFTALGFDYGKKTIGIAVGQSLTATASELTVFRVGVTRESQQALWEQLEKTIEEWNPALLVIGWPLNMDGTESDFCLEVKRFAEKLGKKSGRPVEFMDERLTSREAKMDGEKKKGGNPVNYRKNPVDARAAKIILESWFRQQTMQLR